MLGDARLFVSGLTPGLVTGCCCLYLCGSAVPCAPHLPAAARGFFMRQTPPNNAPWLAGTRCAMRTTRSSMLGGGRTAARAGEATFV